MVTYLFVQKLHRSTIRIVFVHFNQFSSINKQLLQPMNILYLEMNVIHLRLLLSERLSSYYVDKHLVYNVIMEKNNFKAHREGVWQLHLHATILHAVQPYQQRTCTSMRCTRSQRTSRQSSKRRQSNSRQNRFSSSRKKTSLIQSEQ